MWKSKEESYIKIWISTTETEKKYLTLWSTPEQEKINFIKIYFLFKHQQISAIPSSLISYENHKGKDLLSKGFKYLSKK